MSTPDRRNLRFGLKPRSSPADNYLMTTQSKSQAENLKVVNWNRLTVIDPCVYPNWIYDRYQAAGITTLKIKGENIGSVQADETDLAEAGE